MVTTVLDISVPVYRNTVLYELHSIMNMANTSGCPVAKAIFAKVVTQVESGQLQQDNSHAMWQARMDAKADILFQRNQPRSPGQSEYQGNQKQQSSNSQAKKVALQDPRKEVPCYRYNRNYCPHPYDHDDTKLPQKYVHVCDISHKGKKCPANLEMKH